MQGEPTGRMVRRPLISGVSRGLLRMLPRLGRAASILPLLALGSSPQALSADLVAPSAAGPRDQLTAAELTAGSGTPASPIHNAYFMPLGETGPALHEFSGQLSLPETKMQMSKAIDQGHAWFPKVTLHFVSHDRYLIPVERDIVLGEGERSFWRIIPSPGRVWSEAGDGGLSRASFPFVLSAPESNESHAGIASFVYDDRMVSALRFQIVQESALWNRFDAWGDLEAAFTPNAIERPGQVIAGFEAELARRLPVRPWADLLAEHGDAHLGAYSNWGKTEHISSSGLAIDGVIYLQACATRYGDYPYCSEMRHGVFSVTKTLGALVTLLRLAEKYGDGVFDFKIADYVEVTAKHDGWQDVTFADALNMVTGLGDESEDPKSKDRDEDGTSLFWRFMSARTAEKKLWIAFSGRQYPWGPGEVLRYRSVDTFVLAAAMDAYYKSREGEDASLWDMVRDEVLRPIGVFHAPMLHTEEKDGSRGVPILAWGLYLTVDDVVKIAGLLRNGGRHRDMQLLSAAKLKEALYQTGKRGKATSYRPYSYYMSVWHLPMKSFHCEGSIPQMSGYGGNVVQILPGNMVNFYFQDSGTFPSLEIAQAANEIRPFCAR